MSDDALDSVYRYHDGTKHHVHRFARSLGYLDWASQPRPFRAFAETPTVPLYPSPDAAADDYAPTAVTFAELGHRPVVAAPLSAALVGDVLRHSLGLSAWKQADPARWPLRVNPSSGNLHPTEAYVVCGSLPSVADTPGVYHYAPDRHLLEQRCAFDDEAWRAALGERQDVLFVVLTSIHWREAWKYGERAFRYCQHDLGHAVAAVSFAAALVGWRATMLPAFSHRAIAALAGLDRDEDFVDAEREEPGCVIALSLRDSLPVSEAMAQALVLAVTGGRWSGQASQLSEDHVTWSFIDEVATATEQPARTDILASPPAAPRQSDAAHGPPVDARALVLQRRSAVAFDGRATLDRATFLGMLARVLPAAAPPWDSAWWTPRVHLVLFVHRVDDVAPGVYMLVRDPRVLDQLRAACRQELVWEQADELLPLWRLSRQDARAMAARLSCNQDIAADSYFSLGMLAEFDESLQTYGPSFYRQLFWETGMVGQALYLEAEAAGARATGIGCFFDDDVHELLGFTSHAFQSLYHFTVGAPVDDRRLTTEPGYAWERREPSFRL